MAKHLYAAGEKHPKARLSEEDVEEIRHHANVSNMTRKKLARRYGIDKGHLSKIINRKVWKNI